MPALTERGRLTCPMKVALQHHIIRKREKKKREEKEAEQDFERRAKIEEERRRKEEEDSLNLEQIKDQLASLQQRYEVLKDEKHQLFSQLKKVLQEEERRKQREKDLKGLREMQASQQLPHPVQGVMLPTGHYQAHQLQYLTGHSSSIASQSSSHIYQSLRYPIGHTRQMMPVGHPTGNRPHSPESPTPSPIQLYQRSGLSIQGQMHPSTSSHYSKYDHGYGTSGQTSLLGTPSRHTSALHNASSPCANSESKSPYSLSKPFDNVVQMTASIEELHRPMTPPRARNTNRQTPQQAAQMSQQLSGSPLMPSGSPSRYLPPMRLEKACSPFQAKSPKPLSRLYN